MTLRGDRIELHAITAAGSFELQVDQYRYRSQDLADSWDEIPEGEQGIRMSALSTVSGDPKLVESWDEPYSGANPQRLRFRRQE